MNNHLKFVILFWIIFMGHTDAQVNFGSILQKGEDAAGKVAADKGPGLAKEAYNKVTKTKDLSPAVQGDTDLRAYSTYEFVPGANVVFEDHFLNDQAGEFPAQWDLKSGQAEVSITYGAMALSLTDGADARVSPKMKTAQYLTNEYSLEFDYDMYRANDSAQSHPIRIYFKADGHDAALVVGAGSVDFRNSHGDVSLSKSMNDAIAGKAFGNKWHHIAVAVKNHQIKVYVDQYKSLVVPDAKEAYTAIEIGGTASEKTPVIFKSIYICTGEGLNLAARPYTGQKIATNAIRFDYDEARLKPESMGMLNMIAKVMKDNPDLKIEVGAYMYGPGDAAHSQKLSQERTDAVRDQLVRMGVAAARLTSKGYGASKPMPAGTPDEGKVYDTWMEFTKI